MIRTLHAKDFKAVAHLETSQLMQTHPQGMTFSLDKPNVIVGPNGAGKSALLTTLSLLTLSHLTGVSALDDNYTSCGLDARHYWSTADRWSRDYAYLAGLTCDTDYAPALYYRPGHIPGNEDSTTVALMCGYSAQARNYRDLTDKKSSGQQGQALLAKVMAALSGERSEFRYRFMNWRAGKELREFEWGPHVCDFEYQAEALKKRYGAVPATAKPVILMDEPEQSLDARAEALLWKQIAEVDCSQVQVIVATHSLYPLMHPERVHLIEATPGYAQEVQKLL